MEFSFVSVDQAGLRQKGTVEANSEKEVADYLRNNNQTPILIEKKRTPNFSFSSHFKKASNQEIVIFTRQLSSMVLTGLTLIESLTVLKKQTESAQMQNLTEDLIAKISEGSSFSQALSNHKNVFSDIYIALIEAAEAAGMLDKILARLADNLEKSEDLKKRIKGALIYPSIIIIGVVVVIAVINIFVIPQLNKIYQSLNIELPAVTKVVLGISKFFTTFYPVILGFIVIGYFFYKRFKNNPAGRKTIDRFFLKLPVLGQITILSVLDEITRTLSLLIAAGTPIIQSLHIAANVANNSLYKDALLATSDLVEKGIPMSTALENQNIFPQIFIQMAKVGENTGKMDESFGRVSDYFQRDLDIKIRNITSSLEPILVIVLGVIVAFLIFAVITPIYSLVSQIQ